MAGIRQRIYRSAFPYVISDIAAIAAAYYLTLFVRFHSDWGAHFFTGINVFFGFRDTGEIGQQLAAFYWLNAARILSILTATLIFLYAFADLYAVRRHIRRRYAAWNMTLANLSALVIFYGYFYLSRNQFHPRSMFATMLFLNVILALLFRNATAALLRRSQLNRYPVLLLGETKEANLIRAFIGARKPHGIEIAAQTPFLPEEPMEALSARLAELVRRHQTRMILCADRRMSIAQIMQVLEISEDLGQEVKVLSDQFAILVNEAEIPVDFFAETPLVHFAVPPSSALYFRMRRVLDLLAALGLGLVTLPLTVVIALLIKLTSPGPVFFVQERIGINRRAFQMFKFRTMHTRAEELQVEIEEFNESGAGLFKIRKDPRVTPVGRFLRRFSLDELPQIINVLRGEMSLVGPRPLPRRDFANYYEEWHYSRHGGLPGLTCLWQVSGRSDISFHHMCILDDYYLRNQNLMLDLAILLRTFGVVLFARGAY